MAKELKINASNLKLNRRKMDRLSVKNKYMRRNAYVQHWRYFLYMPRTGQNLYEALKHLQLPYIEKYRYNNWGLHNSYIPAMVNYAPGKRLAIFLYRFQKKNGMPKKIYDILEEDGQDYLVLPNKHLTRDEIIFLIQKKLAELKNKTN